MESVDSFGFYVLMLGLELDHAAALEEGQSTRRCAIRAFGDGNRGSAEKSSARLVS